MSNDRPFGYLIKEVHGKNSLPIKFHVPVTVVDHYDGYERETQIVERAAYVHFYGEGGWRCAHGWPLTFRIYTSVSNALVTEKVVFILNGEDPPKFDVI
jgi:hypothetical protein